MRRKIAWHRAAPKIADPCSREGGGDGPKAPGLGSLLSRIGDVETIGTLDAVLRPEQHPLPGGKIAMDIVRDPVRPVTRIRRHGIVSVCLLTCMKIAMINDCDEQSDTRPLQGDDRPDSAIRR